MNVTSTVTERLITVGVIGGNGGVVLGGDQILTAMGLEELIFMGMTYGAWVKVALLISLLIIILLNLKKLWVEILAPLGSMLADYKGGVKKAGSVPAKRSGGDSDTNGS